MIGPARLVRGWDAAQVRVMLATYAAMLALMGVTALSVGLPGRATPTAWRAAHDGAGGS